MGLVRIFLAIVVAIGHWQLLILTPRDVALSKQALLNAAHAVLFFYAISGYLITYHRHGAESGQYDKLSR